MIQLADLPAESPVVRGGSNRDPAALVSAVQTALERTGRPVLSVFIVADAGGHDNCVRQACADGPVVHGKVQVATVGALVDAGFVIADERDDDESYCHFHVYFPVPVTQLEAEAWLRCFSEPVTNPAKEQR